MAKAPLKCMRVVAEDTQDSRWKIIFDGILDGNRLRPQRCFGFAIDIDDEFGEQRWPFLLEPTKDGSAMIEFGPGAADPRFEPVNVFQRDIQLDSYFTRGKDPGASYRIVEIDQMV